MFSADQVFGSWHYS